MTLDKIIITIFLIIVWTNSFSQKLNGNNTKLYFSISPLGLVDYKDGSSIRLGADIRLFKNISISTEAFFYTSLGNFFAYKTDPRGIGIKPLLKYYLNENTRIRNKYLGIEYQYKHQTYNLTDSISISNFSPYFKKYSMERLVNCITLKYGEVFNYRPRLLIEYFGGIGVRFRNSKSSLTEQEYNGIIRGESHSNSTGGGYSAREIGNTILLNISLGIKLGYKILE